MSYFNQFTLDGSPANPDFGLGNNWMSDDMSYMTEEEPGLYGFIWSATDAVWFKSTGSGYKSEYGVKKSLSLSGNVFAVEDSDGTLWKFDATNGNLQSKTSPGGQVTTNLYSASTGKIEETRRVFTEGANTTVESRRYTFGTGLDANRIVTVTLSRATSESPPAWSSYSKIDLTYYGDSDVNGNLGDLKLITKSTWDGSIWQEVSEQYYRYYKDTAAGKGYKYGMKMAVSPEGYKKMTTPLAASDPELEKKSSSYYEYDAVTRRVTLSKIRGGTAEFTFTYGTRLTGINAYNNWLRRITINRPDDSSRTIYSNHVRQELLEDIEYTDGTTKNWITYTQYTTGEENPDVGAAQVSLQVPPAGITGYNDNSANLNPTLVASGSLVAFTKTVYGDDTGNVPVGYVKEERLTKGNGVIETLLRSYEYLSEDIGGGDKLVLVNKIVEYPNDSNTNDEITTNIAYTFFQDGATSRPQIKTSTTTLPVVSSSQNGDGATNTTIEEYDIQGRLIKSTDARGTETTYDYDNVTGTMTEMVQDSGTGGLPITTNYSVDDLGRTTEVLGPTHDVVISGQLQSVRTASWTLYLDAEHQVRSAAGYQLSGSGNTIVGPTSVSISDDDGRPLEQILASPPSSGDPIYEATIARSDYHRWTVNKYDLTTTELQFTGELTSTRVYHLIPDPGDGFPGTNYDETLFGYDSMGRQNRVESPGGTITATVYDPRGLVTETSVGTDDTSGGTNMKPVAQNTYDYAKYAGKNGLVTTATTPVDDTSANDRVIDFTYDWRDRQTAVDAPEDLYTTSTYDNLGRVTVQEQQNGSAGNRVAKNETKYDDRNRVYRTITYAVDVSTGNTGNTLVDNTWYDAAGNTIKSQPSGSEAFSKTTYSALGRQTAQYTGYYTGSGTDNPTNLTDNKIFEQSVPTYDAAGNVLQVIAKQRFQDATSNGALGSPTVNPKCRVTFSATWHDGLDRPTHAADYGTNEDNATGSFTRLATPPSASSNKVLLTKTVYNTDTGVADQQWDTADRETRTTFDDAGRPTQVVQNYVTSGSGSDENITTTTTYTADGAVKQLTAENSDTGPQVTTYSYGTTLPGSGVARSDLLITEQYPDSAGGTDVVAYEYNRQGEVTKKTDQNENIHEYEFDKLGRTLKDKITTLGSNVDGFVQRLQTAYNDRGLPSLMISYDSPTGTLPGNVRNTVRYTYNDFGQLTKEEQEHDGVISSTAPEVLYDYADGSANSIRPVSITYPNDRKLRTRYNPAVVRNAGMEGRWELDEGSGTTAGDSSGNSNDGTITGASWVTNSARGNVLSFDGTVNDYVSLPSTVLNGLSDMTFTTWFKTAKNGETTLLSGANSGNHNECRVSFSDPTTLAFSTGESTTSEVTWTISAIDDDAWHHLVVIRNQTDGKVTAYLDGADQGDETTTLNDLTIDTGGLFLGQDQDSVGGGFTAAQALDGELSGVRLYDQILTSQQVQELYSGPIGRWYLDEGTGTSAADSSGYGNDGTLTGGPTWTTGPAGEADTALHFDGTNDYVNIGDLDCYKIHTGDMSWAAWVNIDNSISDGVIFSQGNPYNANGKGYDFSFRNGDRLSFRVRDGAPSVQDVKYTNSEMRGAWHHVAVTFDHDGNIVIYFDGVSVKTAANTMTGDIAGTNPLYLGILSNATTYPFKGDIADIWCFRRVLSSAEVAELYHGNPDDALSRASRLDWDKEEVSSYTYLGAGSVMGETYGVPNIGHGLAFGNNDFNPSDSLDYFGRMKQLRWQDYSTASPLVDLKHGYNTASDRLYRRNEVARSNSAKFDELYGYDGLSRLDDFDRGELNSTNTAISGSPTLTQDWTLDETGNWGNFQQGVVDILNQDRTHTKANEIDTITRITGAVIWATPAHDLNGNMTTIPQPKALDDSYTAVWDAWNRLVKLTNDADTDKTVAEYQYDATGRRTIKKSYDSGGSLDETRDFYYSAGWQVLEEQVSDTAVEQFVWGIRYIDDLVLRDRSSGGTLNERLYTLQDANWNVVAITNDSGAVQQRLAYDPYGSMTKLDADFTTFTGTDPEWEYTYTGRRLDDETELMYYRMRYYHTELGRFVNRDPIGYEGGTSLYEYVYDSPILHTDAYGLEPVPMPIIPGQEFPRLAPGTHPPANLPSGGIGNAAGAAAGWFFKWIALPIYIWDQIGGTAGGPDIGPDNYYDPKDKINRRWEKKACCQRDHPTWPRCPRFSQSDPEEMVKQFLKRRCPTTHDRMTTTEPRLLFNRNWTQTNGIWETASECGPGNGAQFHCVVIIVSPAGIHTADASIRCCNCCDEDEDGNGYPSRDCSEKSVAGKTNAHWSRNRTPEFCR